MTSITAVGFYVAHIIHMTISTFAVAVNFGVSVRLTSSEVIGETTRVAYIIGSVMSLASGVTSIVFSAAVISDKALEGQIWHNSDSSLHCLLLLSTWQFANEIPVGVIAAIVAERMVVLMKSLTIRNCEFVMMLSLAFVMLRTAVNSVIIYFANPKVKMEVCDIGMLYKKQRIVFIVHSVTHVTQLVFILVATFITRYRYNTMLERYMQDQVQYDLTSRTRLHRSRRNPAGSGSLHHFHKYTVP